VLVGGAIDNAARSGGRFRVGYWCDCGQTVGLEGGYFFLGPNSAPFSVGSPGAGTAVIARPFFNAVTGAEDSQLVNVPGRLNGTVAGALDSRLQGGELNGICNVCCGCQGRVDLLAGFRYLELDEGLGIAEHITVDPGVPVTGGSTFVVNDQFGTRNRFYGGQLGLRAEARWGDFAVNASARFGLGVTQQSSDVAGSTLITQPGQAPVVRPGGLLALPTNSGHFTRDQFAFAPELGVNLAYQVTPNLRAFVGYSFLYWQHVARPGDQIDRVVNPTQLPLSGGPPQLVGAARPAQVLRDTDFWAQGFNIGVEFRY
jgi:hypothetical protein